VCNAGVDKFAEGRQSFPTLTVAENLDMGAMLPRAHAARRQNREASVAMFPLLAERARQAAGTLSAASRQNACDRARPDGRTRNWS